MKIEEFLVLRITFNASNAHDKFDDKIERHHLPN